ncbi:MAG: hypothetical protein V3S00_03230, partial [Dehalococcoidia bacterium]
FDVSGPIHIDIWHSWGGSAQLLVSGWDDGTGGCISGTITPPLGPQCFILEVRSGPAGTLWDDPITCIEVQAAPTSTPTPTATPTATPSAAPTATPPPTTTTALTQGDVDCDGDVDSIDALKIQRFIVGLSVTQTEPCPDIGSPL